MNFALSASLLGLLGCPKPAPPPTPSPAPLPTRRLHHRARNAYVLAHMDRISGDLEGAAEHYQRALVFDPGSPVLVMELGQLRVEQGMLESGQALLQRALELGAGEPARASLCQVELSLEVPVGALVGWEEGSWRWAQCSHAAGGPLQPVLQSFERTLAEQPLNLAAWQAAQAVVHQEQRYATGLTWVQAALRSHPWSAELLWIQVDLAQGGPQGPVRHRGVLISALSQLDALDEPVLPELAQQYAHQRGHAGLLPRIQEPALSAQQLALGLPAAACQDPAWAVPCGLSARCLVSKGQAQRAAERIMQCESMDPQARQRQALAWDPGRFRELRATSPSSPAVLAFGVLAALKAGEPQGALVMALALPSDHPLRPGLEGRCVLALGGDAMGLLTEGWQRVPGEVGTLAALGRAHYQAGDFEQARVWLSLAARSGSSQARDWLAELEAS